MQPIRKARLESLIREELAGLVPSEVKDPRVQAASSITFTHVQLNVDGSQAQVYLTVRGGQAAECVAGLNSAGGYLRRQLSKVLHVKHVPQLLFKEDAGFDAAMRVEALLHEIGKGRSDRGEGGE